MNKTPSFHRSLLGSTTSKIQFAYWDAVLDTYQKKDYKASFYALLDYINPEIRKKFANNDQTDFKIPHGSIVVHIKLTDDQLEINAPFIQLPDNQVVPVLRKVAEINFSPLNLAAIRLKENNLEFYFQSKLSMCEPYKMYYLLKEICQTGDTYDDYFTVKHGAKRLQEPMITPYKSSQAEAAWNQTRAYIDEALEYLNYFDSKRWYEFSYDIIAVTLFKIDYYAVPQGHIRNEIENAINGLFGHGSLHERLSSAKKTLLSIKERGKEAFIEDLYEAEIFVPYKSSLELANVQEKWNNTFQSASKDLTSGNHQSAALLLLYNFFYTLYYYSLPADLHTFMINTLESASGKAWDESAQILFNATKDIVNGTMTPANVTKKKSFLSSLFGN